MWRILIFVKYGRSVNSETPPLIYDIYVHTCRFQVTSLGTVSPHWIGCSHKL